MRLGPRDRYCRCREGLTMLPLVETDNDRTVEVRLGDVVRITLPENASTGYRWTIDRYDEDIIEALGSEPRYPAGDVGSGGEIAFNFKAKKAGSGEIALKHWRHWEGDRSVIGRFRVRLNVQP
jgi:inhibitor of cysteine peptidase